MNVSDIKNVACVGGGVIGSSWAIQYALKGLHVTLYDINDQQLTKSHDQMLRSLDALVAHNAITAARKDEIIACVRPTTSMEEAVQDAQFIQESGPERIEIKRSILAQVEQYAAPDALYASSTSGLLISDIVAEALHPERCIGAHPYNPPHLIPLVELTRCDKTDDDCVQLAYDFYQSIGKEAVLLRKECPGFIANRLQLALYREVQDLVMRGVCSVEDVDKALVYGPGIRWAIFGHNMIMQMGNPGGLTWWRCWVIPATTGWRIWPAGPTSRTTGRRWPSPAWIRRWPTSPTTSATPMPSVSPTGIRCSSTS